MITVLPTYIYDLLQFSDNNAKCVIQSKPKETARTLRSNVKGHAVGWYLGLYASADPHNKPAQHVLTYLVNWGLSMDIVPTGCAAPVTLPERANRLINAPLVLIPRFMDWMCDNAGIWIEKSLMLVHSSMSDHKTLPTNNPTIMRKIAYDARWIVETFGVASKWECSEVRRYFQEQTRRARAGAPFALQGRSMTYWFAKCLDTARSLGVSIITILNREDKSAGLEYRTLSANEFLIATVEKIEGKAIKRAAVPNPQEFDNLALVAEDEIGSRMQRHHGYCRHPYGMGVMVNVTTMPTRTSAIYEDGPFFPLKKKDEKGTGKAKTGRKHDPSNRQYKPKNHRRGGGRGFGGRGRSRGRGGRGFGFYRGGRGYGHRYAPRGHAFSHGRGRGFGGGRGRGGNSHSAMSVPFQHHPTYNAAPVNGMKAPNYGAMVSDPESLQFVYGSDRFYDNAFYRDHKPQNVDANLLTYGEEAKEKEVSKPSTGLERSAPIIKESVAKPKIIPRVDKICSDVRRIPIEENGLAPHAPAFEKLIGDVSKLNMKETDPPQLPRTKLIPVKRTDPGPENGAGWRTDDSPNFMVWNHWFKSRCVKGSRLNWRGNAFCCMSQLGRYCDNIRCPYRHLCGYCKLEQHPMGFLGCGLFKTSNNT